MSTNIQQNEGIDIELGTNCSNKYYKKYLKYKNKYMNLKGGFKSSIISTSRLNDELLSLYSNYVNQHDGLFTKKIFL